MLNHSKTPRLVALLATAALVVSSRLLVVLVAVIQALPDRQ